MEFPPPRAHHRLGRRGHGRRRAAHVVALGPRPPHGVARGGAAGGTSDRGRRRVGVGVRRRRRDPGAPSGPSGDDPGCARRHRRGRDRNTGWRPAQLPLSPVHRPRPRAHRLAVAGTLPAPPARDVHRRAVRLGNGPRAPARTPHLHRAGAHRGAAGIVQTGAGPATRLPRRPDREHARGDRRPGRQTLHPQRQPGLRGAVRIQRPRGSRGQHRRAHRPRIAPLGIGRARGARAGRGDRAGGSRAQAQRRPPHPGPPLGRRRQSHRRRRARGAVRGHQRPQGGRAGHARGAGSGGAGGPGAQRVPRQHESRRR